MNKEDRMEYCKHCDKPIVTNKSASVLDFCACGKANMKADFNKELQERSMKEHIEVAWERISFVKCGWATNKTKKEADKEIEALSTLISCAEELERLKQIIIEDVPHKYQERLLEVFNGK